MKQLVGCRCFVCLETIGSIVEGHFTRCCQRPVHGGCVRQYDNSGVCSLCGANQTIESPVPTRTKDVSLSSARRWQLVGSTCARCYEVINSKLEGHFCSRCRSAIHVKCEKPSVDETECPLCGSEVTEDIASGAVNQAPEQPGSGGRYPISRQCPACGGVNYRRRRPNRWIAFTADRVCNACGTRYSPPTPRWAGIVFILAGSPLVGLGLFGFVQLFVNGLIGLPGFLFEGLLGLLGLLAVVHGVRSLTRYGEV